MKPHLPFTPALALAAGLALLPLASTDAAGPVEIVTTTNAWNRVRSIVSFGEPDTASYGQTFICPIQSSLLSFTVYVMPHNDPGPIDFRFYVMPWNGSRPTAPVLFHSATVSTAGRPAGFQPYEFETVGLQLTPGQAYIAFISASEVFDGISGAGSVGSVDGSTYPNGGFYYLNHGANFGLITNSNWENISSEDLAFTAVFSELTNFPPVITVHPASRTVFENVNLDLTVSAYGSRPIAYQWRKNSLLLPDATNSILRLPQAQVSDSGDYSVTVTNLFGMALSDTGHVTVLPRPPGSRNVLISGSQMTPTLAGYIEALGHSATVVQSDAWATVSLAGYDAVWLGSESAFADLSSRIFDLYDLLDAGGIILAEVTMPGNPLTDYPFGDELSFVVNNGNFVHITAPDHPAVAGLTDGGLSNWDQSWHAYFDSIGSFTGVADTGVSGSWVLLERPFGSGHIAFTSLDISYHIQRGAGPTGPLSPKGILLNNILTLGITNRPPVIVVQPADTRAIVGFDAVLSVQAIGSAPLSFQWLREGTHLPGATSSVLTIPNAQLTDEGNFSVVVSNAAGVVTSMVAHLSVVTSSGVVGYYTDNNVFSRGAEGLITVAGFVPLQIQDISTQPLSAFSILFLNIFDNQFISSELLGRLPDLENWINQGGRLIVHDRSAGNIFPNPLLLGLDPGVPTIRNETPDVDVIPPGDTLVTDGPFGQITDGTLDGGSYSAHGFVPLSALPPDAQPILSIGGQLDACVAFAYPLGRGIVYYSSIPLDCYLPDGDCVSIPVSNPLTNIYAPNVVTYASTLGSGRVLRIANVTGGEGCGQTVDVPITLNSKGDENALAFSLNYDPLLLSDPRVTLGGDAVDAALFVNDSLAASGRLGIALALTPGEAFLDNTTNEVIVVRFVVHPSTTNLVARVTFGDQPIIREVIDVLAGSLRTFFRSGNVSIVAGYEGDVAPRPTGSGHLTIADWSQLGRFAARLDALASPGEFQRADCAPRLTCGDGYLDLFDWVQAGRYMAGLDVWRRVGGPQTNAPDPAPPGPAGSVAVSILPTAFTGGATNTVAIQFHARGSEHAFSFSLNFDPASLTFVGARAGADLIGGLLFVNTNEAASGRVGFTLALAPGSQFAEDVRQIILARFASAPVPICTTTALSFGDQPLPRLASGAQAQSLGTTWTGASIGIAPHGPLLLLISPPHPDGDIDLWIRSADGAPLTPAHAAGIRVYATTNLSVPLANWPVVSNALVPDNGMLRVEGIDNAEVPYRFFRAVGCQ